MSGAEFSGLYCYIGAMRSIFGPNLDPKLGPDRLKNSKFWYQYIYFYFSPKVRNQYIYFAPNFFNILGPYFDDFFEPPKLLLNWDHTKKI